MPRAAGRGRPEGSGLEVAVKSFDAAKCAKDETLATCRDNELEVLRMLKWAADQSQAKRGHPHIANMLDLLGGPDDSHMHAVLEYCDGGTLKRYLQMLQKSVPSGIGVPSEEAGMSSDLCAKATGQLAAALFHLHMLGVAHGDVKPANIMLLHPLQTWTHGTGATSTRAGCTSSCATSDLRACAAARSCGATAAHQPTSRRR